jgi:hypothetical protein
MLGGTTIVSASRSLSRPAGTSIAKPASVMADAAGPQNDTSYSGRPATVAASVQNTSRAAPNSNSATPSNTTIATRIGRLAALSCTLSI